MSGLPCRGRSAVPSPPQNSAVAAAPALHRPVPGCQVSKSRDERLMVFNSHFHTKYRYVFQHVHNRNNTISKPKHMFWEHPGHGTGNMMGEFAFCVPEGTSHSLWKKKQQQKKPTHLAEPSLYLHSSQKQKVIKRSLAQEGWACFAKRFRMF